MLGVVPPACYPELSLPTDRRRCTMTGPAALRHMSTLIRADPSPPVEVLHDGRWVFW